MVAAAPPAGAGSFDAADALGLPLAERLLELALERGHGRVAGDEQRGVVRPVVLVVEATQVLGRDLLDRRLDARHRPAVGMLLAVQQAGHRQVGDGRRAVLAARDRGQQVVAHARELLGVERGVDDDVGEHGERGVQVPAQRRQADVGRVPGAAGRQRRAERRHLIGDGERAARLRPLVQHVRGQVGQPGAVGRVGRSAGLDHEVQVHQRKIVKLDEKYLQPVLELEALPLRGLKASAPGPAGGASWRKGASGVSRPGTAVATGAFAAPAPALGATGLAAGGRRRRRGCGGAGAGGRQQRQSQEPQALHFFTRPMIGASGLGSTVMITRPSFLRYCCAARCTAAASTAR